MLAPIFTHGTYANTVKAIQDGKIKYPAYLWISDRQQYGFLNRQNELEVIGIPEFTGTLENTIVLSTLDDGLYQIKGRHTITADYATVFDTSSSIIVIVQTIGGKKKIRRITTDELTTYTVEEDLSVTSDAVATVSYLEEKGYATEGYVDIKIEAMKAEIEADIDGYIETKVAELIDEDITDVEDEKIEDLFE